MSRQDFTTHPCRWPECGERVEIWRWGCSKHWFALPRDIRSAITTTWARGKGRGTQKHADALKGAQEWIKSNDYHAAASS